MSSYDLPGEPALKFLSAFREALDEGNAALFCGAGVSVGAGFEDWRSLLIEIARDLALDVDRTDLISLAQYGLNQRGRNHINERILDKFVALAKPNDLQNGIARLPIDHVWTTNFDSSLEECYRKHGRIVDIKTDEVSLSHHKRGADVTVYKMHGDASQPNNAIITKEDYETYALSKRGQVFSIALQTDLISRTFLFLGFSFSDPNLDQILSRVRYLIGESQREHYAIMKRPKSPEGTSGTERAELSHEWKRTELQIEDLEKRYKIRTVLVDEYEEIPKLVAKLGAISRRSTVFVSGAIASYGAMPKPRFDSLVLSIGERLESEGMGLVCGLGVGVGAVVSQGFFLSAYTKGRASGADRATLRPFPQPATGEGDVREFWATHRRDMIGRAGFIIFAAGNKLDDVTGAIVRSNGMDQELTIALEEGAYPIPIGVTGDVAAEFLERFSADPFRYYGSANVSPDLETLGRANATNGEIVDAVFNIIRKVNESRF